MPEVLIATPLKYSTVTHPYTFSDGISIRELSPILWETSNIKRFISAHEQDELANTRYWLCASKDVAHVYADVGEDLYLKATHALRALQIICPSGSKNVFLKFVHTQRGYDNIGSKHPKELRSTLIGRITSAEDLGFAQDFEAVYSGVERAFTEKIVRLQNPILLLEHGTQIGNTNLGALMFVMGLDVLMMAGKKLPFMERLGGFLGPQSYIFPPDFQMHRQPAVKAQDVLAQLYDLRNIIAHGQEIPKIPYRRKYDLLDDNNRRINHGDYHYAELMLESGLFLLTGALRKIFVEGLFDDVCNVDQWRLKLRLYQHRSNNAAAIAPPREGS